MPLKPEKPLTQLEFDAINAITAYYESDLEQADFIYVPHKYHMHSAMYFLKSDAVYQANSQSMWKNIVSHGEGVDFGRKEVGALFRYRDGNYTSFVTTEYLMKLPQRMNLTDAQLHEVERLLNKAETSLGYDLAPLPAAKDDDMKEALFALLLDAIEDHPKIYHQKFLDSMARKGAPVKVATKDFKALVQSLLKV